MTGWVHRSIAETKDKPVLDARRETGAGGKYWYIINQFKRYLGDLIVLPSSFHDLTAFMEVAPATWRAVLDIAGETHRLAGETLTQEELLASLTAEPPGPELRDALEAIHELGSDAGRELLQQAADDVQVSLGLIDEVPARELVARLWVESRTTDAMATLLTRARVNSPALSQERQCREFAGKRGATGPIDREALATAIKSWCAANSQNADVFVSAYQRGDECWYEVLRGDPLKRVVEMRNSRPNILDYRPASSDLLRYDPKAGRLAIATRSPRRLQMYRQIAGSLLSDDQEFFTNENICTLRPLQGRGRALFEFLPPEIFIIDVVELRWRRGDRGKLLLQDRDCLALVEEFGIRMTEGKLIEARLSVTFAGAARRGSVSIKVPNRIEINAGMHEALIESVLDEVGIRGQFDDSGQQLTVWSLYPWREPAERWRKCLGIDFDGLAEQGLLRAIRMESTTPPDHPAATGALTVVPLGNSLLVGVSEDPAINLRTLTVSDVEGFELDGRRLADRFQAELHLVGPVAEVDDGILLLGHLTLSESVTISLFLALREPSADAEQRIRGAAQSMHVALIAPLGCRGDLGVPQVTTSLRAQPDGRLLPRVIERLKLQDVLDPPLWAREELIFHEERGQVWFKGELLTKLTAGTSPYKFALEVARAKGRLVTKNELNDLLSASRTDGETARAAKLGFLRALKNSFEAAGKANPPEAKGIFASPNHGYRINVTSLVI